MEGKYDDLMNVYVKYYNTTVDPKPDGTPNNHHMFENIDYNKEESTNNIMECFYEEMLKHATSKDEDKVIYEYDVEHYHANNKYILLINDSPNKSCNLILPLLSYVSTIDWINTNWIIESI